MYSCPGRMRLEVSKNDDKGPSETPNHTLEEEGSRINDLNFHLKKLEKEKAN